MTKSFYLVLIILLLFVACAKGSTEEPVPEEPVPEEPDTEEFISIEEFIEKWRLTPYIDICTFGADGWFFPRNWTKEDIDAYFK